MDGELLLHRRRAEQRHLQHLQDHRLIARSALLPQPPGQGRPPDLHDRLHEDDRDRRRRDGDLLRRRPERPTDLQLRRSWSCPTSRRRRSRSTGSSCRWMWSRSWKPRSSSETQDSFFVFRHIPWDECGRKTNLHNLLSSKYLSRYCEIAFRGVFEVWLHLNRTNNVAIMSEFPTSAET